MKKSIDRIPITSLLPSAIMVCLLLGSFRLEFFTGLLRRYSKFEVVFLFVPYPPAEGWLDSGADRYRPSAL